MTKEFERAYRELNREQRQAVDQIDGPVLVIAGPGTGKTQLISTRVGRILSQTDTLPANILLLTYTEAAAETMRERLASLIGQAAYEINISTYHAFGSHLIHSYPDFFENVEVRPIDDLGQVDLLAEITSHLPYSNPLRYTEGYYGDIISFISDCKKAKLEPADVRQIAKLNLEMIEELNRQARGTLDELVSVSPKSVPVFSRLQGFLEARTAPSKLPSSVLPLTHYANQELSQALESFAASKKTQSLTAWKNSWLAKDNDGRFIFDGRRQNQKIEAAAEVYARYQRQLQLRRLYDYDDMILRAIRALEKFPDFKFSVAEQYQYIMLDEFQDTNPAQLRLIELLTDHPVHEGRPNILAVGDDDQAIYAFQGADHANMLSFVKLYNDVKIVSLKQNYRSRQEIITVGQNLAGQIEQRLQANLPNVAKKLVAANQHLPKPTWAIHEFKTDAAEYEWLAKEIKRLVAQEKLAASDIAVLAPKHKYLIELLPYLARQDIPVHYEKRENILDSPLVRQLEQMARLALALGDDWRLADGLWPEVLSYDFWAVPTETIWQISWQADKNKRPWTQCLLDNKATRDIAVFFLRLKDLLSVTTLEQQLDILIGNAENTDKLKLPLTSPLYPHYFAKPDEQEAVEYIRLLSNLNVLRQHLREHQRLSEQPLSLQDFISFIDANRAAGLNIIDANPYFEGEHAVNLMTAYAAKGREFTAVFVIAAVDEVWGSASRNQGQRISLPANLKYIRYQGASEDERLRLLFVAASRAKTHLYFSSYSQALDGRRVTRLKYLQITETADGQAISAVIPTGYQKLIHDDIEAITLYNIEDYWSHRHAPPFRPKLHELLAPRLKNYQLSPSHLNRFTDLIHHGPQDFFISSLLRFPEAPSPEAAYGTAVHNSLRWLGNQLADGRKPTLGALIKQFESQLNDQRLLDDDYRLLQARGKSALENWFAQRGRQFQASDKYEFSFAKLGVFIGDVHLTGKLDRLMIDEKQRIVSLVDFKTGRPLARWAGNSIKSHRFRQQLLSYKLLLQTASRFKGYRLGPVMLEFIEPDEDGRIVQLELNDTDNELEAHKRLLIAVWRRIKQLDLPDTSSYAPTMAGIRQFENDLIKEA